LYIYKEIEMEEMTYSAKLAVLKVLNDIIYADNVINDKEVEYLHQVAASYGLGGDYKSELAKCLTLQALSEIRQMSAEQKNEMAKMMGKMIVIDGDINYNEVKIYNEVCKACNIEEDFHIDAYPDLTLSGPFVNPEDI
jgi:uncharacterized tellurite resistance protein B-like protein